jgi:4'-phosphopantetheinyl transferase
MKVTLLDMDRDLTWGECKEYANLLSEDRKEKCLRYVQDEKKIMSLFCSLLIQEEIAKGRKLEFKYNEYGKPYVVGNEDVYFSVSHSGKYIAFIKDKYEVGIDIEEIKKFKTKVVGKFFTAEERDYLSKIENNLNIEGYKIWTQKEAYLKKIGTGFAKGGFKINTLDKNIQQHIKTTQIENYMLTIAAEENRPEIELKKITSKEFITNLNNKLNKK